jgi:protein-S-isoprenylcysteine O-methyltransferase Ste14
MAAGLSLGLLALLHFRQRRTTFVPHGEPTALVMAGPYMWTRNPMYLGLFTLLLGFALYSGGLPLFLAPAAFSLILDRAHIPYEEARLSKLFGEAYNEYQKRVARWL